MDIPETLPTYEETLESTVRKTYELKYPQLLTRTVHATTNNTVAVVRKVKGLSASKMEFLVHSQPKWNCKREQNGFELVFTRQTTPVGTPCDDKPADSREYLHRENDAPPPVYEDNREVRLESIYPFPFRYDFEFLDTKLRWMRNPEAKSPGACLFSCVERPNGRVMAEVRGSDDSLGTVIVHGDLDADLHEFLVVSAIPVIEEYPVRHLEYIR
ncbi:hypothetical protein BX070DRAFT_1893 [Coemansia spiralis]|nr:hypothetical protein BX070DRAFT_1893 [Coemansia spiralis]